MSYLQFHLVFTIPLLALVLFLGRKNKLVFSKKGYLATGLLCLLALTYTTPWDSYLIREKIWTYENDRVLGTLFYIPFEEYFFFFIQTIIGCFLTGILLTSSRKDKNRLLVPNKRWILASILFPLAIALFIWVPISQEYRYLWLIAIWSLPVLVLQWSVGLPVLKKEWKTWSVTLLTLCSYFWAADSFAIYKNIWSFPEGTISGWNLFGILPLEEALFFLVTNLMVIQGYILFTTVNFEQSRLWLPGDQS